MKNRLLAALVVALAFCVVNTRATDSQVPPALIHIGTDQEMFEGAVNNVNHAFGTNLKFTNITNGTADSRPAYSVGLAAGFPSFAAYTSFTISNNYYHFLRFKPLMDPSKELKLYTYVVYAYDTGGTVVSLESRPTVGIVSAITSNSFVSAFAPTNLCVVIPIPGLEEYVMEVPGVYTNSWPATAGRPAQTPPPSLNLVTFPPELTTNGVVVINSIWGRHAFDLRVSIKVGGVKYHYTQFGSKLGSPPTLNLSLTSVSSQFSRGARVTIMTSTDLRSWLTATNFSDLSGVGQFSLPYSKNQPRLFYKVGVR